jgi:hypothetical protein
MEKLIKNLVFKIDANTLGRKLMTSAENIDHNIDPWLRLLRHWMTFRFTLWSSPGVDLNLHTR